MKPLRMLTLLLPALADILPLAFLMVAPSWLGAPGAISAICSFAPPYDESSSFIDERSMKTAGMRWESTPESNGLLKDIFGLRTSLQHKNKAARIKIERPRSIVSTDVCLNPH